MNLVVYYHLHLVCIVQHKHQEDPQHNLQKLMLQKNLPLLNLNEQLQDNLLEGNLLEGNLLEGNLLEGNLLKGNLLEGNLPKGNLLEGKHLVGNLLEGKHLVGPKLKKMKHKNQQLELEPVSYTHLRAHET